MSDKGIDLGDYIQVKDRIAKFYELFGGGRLVTTEVRATSEPDGKPRIWVEAKAYRTVDDPLPGVGWSWLELPGGTNFTRGSELENAETSAWGRAIGSLGILIDVSVASQHEIESKTPPARPAAAKPAPQPRSATPPVPTTNEPPEISDAELDSLAGVPTVQSQAAERVAEHRAARVAEQPAAIPIIAEAVRAGQGMTLSDFMVLKGEKGIQFGPEFTAAVNELTPGLAWSKYTDANRYALAVKLGMVES